MLKSSPFPGRKCRKAFTACLCSWFNEKYILDPIIVLLPNESEIHLIWHFPGGADASLAGGANGCTGLFSGFSFLFILLSCSSARCELAQWCAIRSAEEVSSGGGRRLCTRLPVLWQPGFRPSFAPSLFALTSLWKNINDKRFDRAQATFWALHSLGRTGSAQVCSVNFSRYHGSFWEKEFWVAYFKPVCLIVSSFFVFFLSLIWSRIRLQST